LAGKIHLASALRPGWQGPAKGEGMALQRHTELPNSRKWRPKIKTAVSILSNTALLLRIVMKNGKSCQSVSFSNPLFAADL